ncbi:type II toxin-antitoxin system VapC family toxin [Cysteiniphilum litorale]|uniref:type II toxin-antitoxin system VapC family toxin n=1 Tax=Cysteiniphilum litorale TaxID=2056700 RepID=UPI003F88066F
MTGLEIELLKLITDTSVIIAVITNEKTKSQLIELTMGYELYAPTSLHWEIGNAISAMYKRKSINEKDGHFILSEYKKMPIALVDIDLIKSLNIAHQHNIYAYDAYMIQCAVEHKAQLVTLDRRLSEIANKMNIRTIEVN